MRKRYKFAIGGFTTLVIIFMIIITFVLNGIIIKQSIENAELKNKIKNLEQSTNEKINELATSLINAKIIWNQEFQDTNSELSKIKVSNNEDFSGIIENSINSVVTVRTLTTQGTGFFIDENGHIITNAHILVSSNEEISKVIQILDFNDETHPAEFLAYIKELDLALLKIEKNSTPLEFANSDEVKIGEKVIAIGNPEGFSFSVTDGIVSQVKRVGLNQIPAYIQTNAELNQGNSGGPLINKEGKLIGINNFKLANSEGIGFALESNEAKKGINEMGLTLYNKTLID